MAKLEPTSLVAAIHGKTDHKSDEYNYVVHGKQYARRREENYQKNQSPRQKWNSSAFAYAHKQLHALNTPDAIQAYTQAWHDAQKIGPNGSSYQDAKAWKFASLQQEWKTAHPFDQWYEDYIQHVSETAAEKTQSERTSTFMLQQQIDILSAQVEQLTALLKNKNTAKK